MLNSTNYGKDFRITGPRKILAAAQNDSIGPMFITTDITLPNARIKICSIPQ